MVFYQIKPFCVGRKAGPVAEFHTLLSGICSHGLKKSARWIIGTELLERADFKHGADQETHGEIYKKRFLKKYFYTYDIIYLHIDFQYFPN